jgi:hypothetical protein
MGEFAFLDDARTLSAPTGEESGTGSILFAYGQETQPMV